MSELRRRAYEILENAAQEPAGRLLNGLLIGLIIANVAAIILNSVPSIHARYGAWFGLFEWRSIRRHIGRTFDEQRIPSAG